MAHSSTRSRVGAGGAASSRKARPGTRCPPIMSRSALGGGKGEGGGGGGRGGRFKAVTHAPVRGRPRSCRVLLGWSRRRGSSGSLLQDPRRGRRNQTIP